MAGFHLFDDSVQGACLGVMIVFTPICLVATALRFKASKLASGTVCIEDWLALGALVFYIIWVGASCFALANLNGRDITEMSPTEISNTFKVIWASSLFFAPNQLCAKLSILCLYNRLFGVNPTYVHWIKGLAFFQTIWSIETPLVGVFNCTPVKKYWDPTVTGGSCINIGAYLAANETMNSLVDFVMAGLAMVMLRKLHTSSVTKVKLALVFAIGGLAGIIGFIKIGLAFNVSVHNQIQMGLWATLQMAFSIICCCVITYGPLFARFGGLGRLTSRIATYGSRQQVPRADSVARSARYIDLDGCSRDRGNIKTEIGSSGMEGLSTTNLSDRELLEHSHELGYALKTVRVHQRVEIRE